MQVMPHCSERSCNVNEMKKITIQKASKIQYANILMIPEPVWQTHDNLVLAEYPSEAGTALSKTKFKEFVVKCMEDHPLCWFRYVVEDPEKTDERPTPVPVYANFARTPLQEIPVPVYTDVVRVDSNGMPFPFYAEYMPAADSSKVEVKCSEPTLTQRR